MKKAIIPKDNKHLRSIILEEIQNHGTACDLNHIDISQLESLASVFYSIDFNGDISNWNTRKVRNMVSLFELSTFNGDISRWNVSNVRDMESIFINSQFNSDISQWDVSNVIDMSFMFCQSQFNKDISKWNVYNVINMSCMFQNCPFNGSLNDWQPYNLANNLEPINLTFEVPYWLGCHNEEEKSKAIDNYIEKKNLSENLTHSLDNNTKTIFKKVKL
jgi:surface protein